MKKITKIILIAAISLVVVGGIMFGVGCLFGGIRYLKSIEYAKEDYDVSLEDDYDGVIDIYNKYNQGHGLVEKLIGFANAVDEASKKTANINTKKTANKNAGRYDIKLEKTELGKFDSVDIDIKHLDVVFRKSNDDKFYIEYNVQSKDNTNPFSYDIKDNTLYLKESKGFTAQYYNKLNIDIDLLGIHIGDGVRIGDNIFSKYDEKDIDNIKNVIRIYIPTDKKFDNINAVMNKGDLFMVSIKSNEFSVELKEGDFIAETLGCDIINMQLDEGDIVVSNIDCKSKMNTNLIEGDVIVSDINVKSANIILEEGDIMFSDVNASENAKIFSEEGDIMGSGCDILGVLDVGTIDGDIIIDIGKNCVDKINIYVRNEDGDNMIAKHFKGKWMKSGGNRIYTRKTSTDEGSINIETEEGDIILN